MFSFEDKGRIEYYPEDIFQPDTKDNLKDLKSYINVEGYFGNSIRELDDNIEKNITHYLRFLSSLNDKPFGVILDEGKQNVSYSYFIPSSKVKRTVVVYTFDEHKIFNSNNADSAKSAYNFIGVEGYFADTLDGLIDSIRYSRIEYLDLVIDNSDFNTTHRFLGKENIYDIPGNRYNLFLPLNEVQIEEVEQYSTSDIFKPEEKTEYKNYRPFKNYEEFNTITLIGIGDTIKIRYKNPIDSYQKNSYYVVMVSGVGVFPDGEKLFIPTLQGAMSFRSLFNNFEIYLFDEWRDFGALK